MAETRIEVERLCKRFSRGEHHDSLRDLAGRWLSGHFQRGAAPARDFWAVNKVSFEVRAGEAFGVIGPNGAGKSTILRILAGIMPPDRGRVSVRGRVSALIELGAGFHPDLTGRENIFLNASILGMSRREVRAKFEAIADFAGIHDFLDTPVKRYSSGMFARLGFAIAVHAEPAVLLVDEVLSVGDRVFRERCMARMREFLRRGVAVVFVSHDLEAVQRFCTRALVLCDGKESYIGPAAEAVGHYWGAATQALLLSDRGSESPVRVNNVRVSGPREPEKTQFLPGDAARLEFDVEYKSDLANPSYGLSLIRLENHLTAFETSSTRLGFLAPAARAGDVHRVRYDFRLNVNPGLYAVGLHVRDRDALQYAAEDAYAMQIAVISEPVAGGPAYLEPTVKVEVEARQSSEAIPT